MRVLLLAHGLLLSGGLYSQFADSLVQQIVDRYELTGVQISYQTPDSSWNYAIGYAQTEPPETVGTTTRFEGASLTKAVVAYTALRLHDRHLLHLDTPLVRYFHSERLRAVEHVEQITARTLLTHTSGLPNWTMHPDAPDWPLSILTTQFTPGTEWKYSGEGFVLLQEAMESITGIPLDKLVAEEVFQPFDMQLSGMAWTEDWRYDMALGHDSEGKQQPLRMHYCANGAYSLITTASDFQKFARGLLRGEGLRPATWQLMISPIVPALSRRMIRTRANKHIFWGLGLGIQADRQGNAFWHWGNNGTFKSFFIAFPEQQASLVFLCNHRDGLRAVKDLLPIFLPDARHWVVEWGDCW